jgi:hypothetical protein
MSETLNKLALSQVALLLRDTMKKDKSLSSITMPDNLADMMYLTMCEQTGESAKVSVRDVLPCRIPLPFMPDLIDYKIGKGCCDEIVKSDCLFVPCSKHCEDGNKCKAHTKEASGLGDYWARYKAWEQKELYCIVINEKELKEKPYGTYLHGKRQDSNMVAEELKKWGTSLKVPAALCRPPPKPMKKNRGRKAERKVESTETDEDTGSGSSGDELELDEPEVIRGVDPLPAQTELADSDDEEPKAETKKKPKKEPESDDEEPKAEPEKKEKPKPKKEKAKKIVKGTPLDADSGELKKEEMEEKVPKKGKFRGKKESLTEAEHDGEKFLTKDGKYYNTETLELIAWTKNGEFTLL